jgi:predicted transcriptional regulator
MIGRGVRVAVRSGSRTAPGRSSMKRSQAAPNQKAKDVMTRNVLRVQPDWPIEQLTQFLVKHSISGAPVTAEDGQLIGVVSLTDVARANTLTDEDLQPTAHDYYLQMLDAYDAGADIPRLEREASQVKVSEIMTPVVIDVDHDATVQRVAEIMIENRVHRLFVTQGGKIEGVVTTLDMLKAIRDL